MGSPTVVVTDTEVVFIVNMVGPGPLLCHPNAPPSGTKGTKALCTYNPVQSKIQPNPAVASQKVLSPAQQVLGELLHGCRSGSGH